MTGADLPLVWYGRSAARPRLVSTLDIAYPGADVLVVCPRLRARAWPKHWRVLALEDLADKQQFLDVHASIGPESVLVLDGASRVTNLQSDRFTALHRLRRVTRRRHAFDVVPFQVAIDRLYLPWSYLDRDMLGYSNGWAFQANYLEEDKDGRTRHAHDLDFLAEKLARRVDLLDGAMPQPTVLTYGSTGTEREAYQARKVAQFEKYKNPRRIVTNLADQVNLERSRLELAADLVSAFTGRVVCYTNLRANEAKLARHLRARLGREVECRSYMSHDGVEVPADMAVIVELPINQNRTWFFDVLADLPTHCRLVVLRGDSRVEAFVAGEVDPEWSGNRALVVAIAEEKARCVGT